MAQTVHYIADDYERKRINTQMERGERLPDGFHYESDVYMGSPKEKTYDICGLIGEQLVSEKLANIIRQHGGPEVRLFPLRPKPFPEELKKNPAFRHIKHPVTQPYYLLEPPVISCVNYEYGDALPTTERWREQQRKLDKHAPGHHPSPETNKPIVHMWINLEKIRHLPLFIPAELPNCLFASARFIEACKDAKLHGIDLSYSMHESMELTRRVQNESLGIEGLLYEWRGF